MPLTGWNEISINSKLINGAKKRQFVGFARNAANTRFVVAKQGLLESIDEHPISAELRQGAESEPSSDLIEDGSLRAFIGFYPQDTPVEDLKKYFNDNTKLSDSPRISDNGKNKIYYDFKVSVPSSTQLDSEKIFATPDNWRSGSWISIIEKGTSTAVHFIMAKLEKTAERFSKGGSRSGWGLQKEDVDTGRNFSPAPYISEIIQNFINRFK